MCPIADIPQIKDSLEALIILESAERPQQESILVQEAVPATRHDGNRFLTSPVWLASKAGANLTVGQLVRRLEGAIQKTGHPIPTQVAPPLLGLSVTIGEKGDARLRALNETLESFVNADVSHFVLLPSQSRGEPFERHGYRFGALNEEALEARCRKAGSDYAQLYANYWKPCFAIQSPIFQRRIFDVLRLFDRRECRPTRLAREMLLNYFTPLARFHFDQMWEHLDESQHLLAAFDCETTRSTGWRKVPSGGQVTIYLNFSRGEGGYVVPEQGGVTINQPSRSDELFARQDALTSELALDTLSDSDLGHTVRSVARFMFSAKGYADEGRLSDALLHYVIGLELLFSERQATTDRVCSRSAAAAYHSAGKSFSDMFKELQSIYEARSRYVHQGQVPSRTMVDSARFIVREVLRSLLKLHRRQESHQPGFVQVWTKRLDLIRATHDAGLPVSEELASELGLTHS